MPIENILVLGLIVAAFAAFSGTLAWVSWTEGKGEQQRAKQTAPPSSFTPRHA